MTRDDLPCETRNGQPPVSYHTIKKMPVELSFSLFFFFLLFSFSSFLLWGVPREAELRNLQGRVGCGMWEVGAGREGNKAAAAAAAAASQYLVAGIAYICHVV
ncbi:hypothetical protein F4809DRAFT_114362 [Biscogniauxia mediterranea]|nr:hypothetical protein F4809DRAFT_114362 [Biscogniauxia mediterranea]